MYKASSDNLQSRALRSVLNSKENSAGIDPDVLSAEKIDLINRKRMLEADISEMSARITRAKSNSYNGGGHTSPRTYLRWNLDKVEKTREINQIEARLAEIKSTFNKISPKNEWSDDQYMRFFKAFHKTAKDMLADPVYERLRIAAWHRASEETE